MPVRHGSMAGKALCSQFPLVFPRHLIDSEGQGSGFGFVGRIKGLARGCMREYSGAGDGLAPVLCALNPNVARHASRCQQQRCKRDEKAHH